MKKICKKCNIEKELTDFYVKKDLKDGYFNKCKSCCTQYSKDNEQKIKTYKVEYRANNKDIIKKEQKEYRESNKDKTKKYKKDNANKINLQQKKYRIDNKEKIQKQTKKYRDNNKEQIRERNRVYTKNKKSTNIIFKLSSQTRSMISKAIKNGGYKKNTKTCNILGCTYKEFKIYLEGELILLNHYTNLQPLCSKVNRDIKRGRV